MIIATRTLLVRSAAGKLPVIVALHRPVEADRSWECIFEIGWPEGRESSRALGHDGVQAMHLAMQKIASLLYMSRYHKEGSMTWDGEPGYGFPLSPAARDLAVGEDKAL